MKTIIKTPDGEIELIQLTDPVGQPSLLDMPFELKDNFHNNSIMITGSELSFLCIKWKEFLDNN